MGNGADITTAERDDDAGRGAAIALGKFLATVEDLNPAERKQVVEAAMAMLDQTYVHLPLKRALYAIDPLRRLKLLQQHVGEISPRQFHDEMIAVFHSLHDLHTNYILPAPYQNKTAFLPFLVEEFYEGSPAQRRYVLSKLIAGFNHPTFVPGVRLTHCSGIPIDRAVERNAAREAGSNDDARHARGLEALTIRPMALTAPPEEEWVIVGYEAGGQAQELRFDWQVFVPPPSPSGINLTGVGADMAKVLGVDARTEAVRRAKKTLFQPEAMRAERAMANIARTAGLAGPDGAGRGGSPGRAPQTMGTDARAEAARRTRKALFFPEAMAQERRMTDALAGVSAADQGQSLMPDVFMFRRVQTPNGEFGYIRIWTFMVQDADDFVTEFVRIARLLPQSGLIIDVRGNGGGNILAGERLLQVLTPRMVEPERLHFINTPTVLELCQRASSDFDLEKWVPSISQALETGEIYSQGFSLDAAEAYNRLGQQYQGPVVLIIDALCYSTTDIFSAGFQDHKVGKILGVHRHTGAGGANVWEYQLLQGLLPNRFAELPKGTSFRVAIRRTTRVGDQAGMLVEDVGVRADEYHQMTLADVMQDNVDLIAKAAEILADQMVRSLSGQIDRSQPPAVRLQVKASHVTRVDVFLGGRPMTSGDIQNGGVTLDLPASLSGPGILELHGFDQEKLVAGARVQL